MQSKEINLIYCNTNNNVVDMFTKPLGRAKFMLCIDKLVVINNSFLH